MRGIRARLAIVSRSTWVFFASIGLFGRHGNRLGDGERSYLPVRHIAWQVTFLSLNLDIDKLLNIAFQLSVC